jgi:hypothetical protein
MVLEDTFVIDTSQTALLTPVILTKVRIQDQAGRRSLLWILTFVRMTELEAVDPVPVRLSEVEGCAPNGDASTSLMNGRPLRSGRDYRGTEASARAPDRREAPNGAASSVGRPRCCGYHRRRRRHHAEHRSPARPA